MTTQEAGAMGGKTTRAKKGVDHFAQIGREGGRAKAARLAAEKEAADAARAALGTCVHVMMTATNGAGELDRRRCLETRSDRRAARRAMAELAKKRRLLGVIPGLGTCYEAKRTGGGWVKVKLVECPAGGASDCKGECQGPSLPSAASASVQVTPAAASRRARGSVAGVAAILAMSLGLGPGEKGVSR